MKKILSFSLYLIFPVITFFAVFLIYASFKDFEPKETVILFKSENPDLLSDTATYSIITWDIGYCALGKEASFIYDGGKDITIPENKVKENILKIKEILSENKQNDFILLQEVDKDSKRSYYFNEFDTISNLFLNRHSVYGKNYDVFFVPSPPQKPEGKINSGL
ncbi:MAG: hypothetical protein GXO50_01030, partial [Chlorobi bacterium]|nr:hypothetical protein [Chlorobiota bacterium]